jgi:glycosyltransferase involved in cell wall biosynthesis
MKKVIMLLTNTCVKDPRVEFEASTLAKAGYSVEILAWDREGNLPLYVKRNNFIIRRIRLKAGYGLGLISIIKFFLFNLKAVNYLSKIKNLQIIHCNDLDTMPAGVFLKIFKKVKLIYDAHEIYPDMFSENFFINKVLFFIDKKLAGFADLFFTVGGLRKSLYEKKRYRKKPVILGSWKSKSKLKVNVKKEKTKHGIKDKIIILYIGALNKERELLKIIDAVKSSRRFALIIAGSGILKSRVIDEAERNANIKYLGFLKDEKNIDYYNSLTDVIFYGIDAAYKVANTATPNKMFEAIANDKIFYCTKIGEMKHIAPVKETPFIFIRNMKNDLNDIYKIFHDKKKRKEITWKNNALYKKYNAKAAKKILLENYAKLK